MSIVINLIAYSLALAFELENQKRPTNVERFQGKEKDFEDRFGDTTKNKDLEVIAGSEPVVIAKGPETKREFEQQQT